MADEVDELIEKLPLVDTNILEEAARQPLLFIEASRHRVDCMRKRAQAAARVDYFEARVATVIRTRHKDAGKRISEAGIRELVGQNKKLRQAQRDLSRAEEDEEFSKLLLDAFKQRRDAIRITAETRIAEGMRESHELDRIDERRKLANTTRRLVEQRHRH